jgi:hypothetical protein
VCQLPVAASFDLTRDQVAAHRVERRGPPAPADLVAFAERLQPLVITDRMAVVLGHVVTQVDAESGQIEAVGPPVVVDGPVAGRARG